MNFAVKLRKFFKHYRNLNKISEYRTHKRVCNRVSVCSRRFVQTYVGVRKIQIWILHPNGTIHSHLHTFAPNAEWSQHDKTSWIFIMPNINLTRWFMTKWELTCWNLFRSTFEICSDIATLKSIANQVLLTWISK